MTALEKGAWGTFVSVVKNFSGNDKTENYKDEFETIIIWVAT